MAEDARSDWTALLRDYCRRIDTRDLAGMDAVFVTDCVVQYGEQTLRGLPALREYLSGQLERFALTRHRLGDVEILTQAPDAPRTLARIEAWHRFHPRDGRQRPDLTLFGRFESRFARTPVGWRIAEHRGTEDARESAG